MKNINITADFGKTIGKIKPMHAINNPPMVPYDFYDGLDRYQEAGIMYARLHDTGGQFGGARYVDIANIFPNFDADEMDPESYDFAFNDVMIGELMKHGVKPFYRLGASIENYHRIKTYNIFPPKDPAKWARICEMIIRHYNEGWNNGFHYDIEYWEIWNEPDNNHEIKNNPMWKGTPEQFYELYEVTYKHLKKCFPHLNIGGYGSCGFYAISGDGYVVEANSSPRTEHFVTFFLDFMKHIKERGIGLDFFSWHSYASVEETAIHAEYARKILDEYGYTSTTTILNEWNPGKHNRGKLCDASNILAMMCSQQNGPTDMLMYYDGNERSPYCGIIDAVSHTIFKAYYAFFMFNKLYILNNQNECAVDTKGCYAIAASNEGKGGVVIANTIDEDVEISLKSGLTSAKVYIVDNTHNNEEIDVCVDKFIVPAGAIAYIEGNI